MQRTIVSHVHMWNLRHLLNPNSRYLYQALYFVIRCILVTVYRYVHVFYAHCVPLVLQLEATEPCFSTTVFYRNFAFTAKYKFVNKECRFIKLPASVLLSPKHWLLSNLVLCLFFKARQSLWSNDKVLYPTQRSLVYRGSFVLKITSDGWNPRSSQLNSLQLL